MWSPLARRHLFNHLLWFVFQSSLHITYNNIMMDLCVQLPCVDFNLILIVFQGARLAFLCQPAFGKKLKTALFPHFHNFYQNCAKMCEEREKVYFNQCLECVAPKRWSKYTTAISKNQGILE